MQRLHVFVDESGDEHLHIDRGASSKYVLSAVCVQGKDLDDFLSTANNVRRFYFQKGEIKSSKVGNDYQRRKLILAKLSELKFWSLSFVVAKDRIRPNSGLRFAPSFLKYAAMRLCSHLPLVDEINISFDEKGRARFKEEFRRYMSQSFERPDLFRAMTFDHINSKEFVAVQVADFLAGSVGKLYANRAASIESGIDRLLREKTSVLEWPTLRAEGLLPDQENDRFDEVVRREAFARAQEYLDFNVNSSEDDIMLRCVFIDWLVSHALLGSSEFLLADGILHRVNIEHGVDIDAQALRNRVVGPLRDHGVLIASSTKGYKIPDCLEDLKKYVDLCASQIPPAVSRLRRARDALRLATGGELDLLAGHDLAHLRSIADSL